MRRLDLPGLKRTERAFECDDGTELRVRMTHRVRGEWITFHFAATVVDATGSPLADGPPPAEKTHTLNGTQASASSLDLDALIDAEAEATAQNCENLSKTLGQVKVLFGEQGP